MTRPDFIMLFRQVLDHEGCSKIDAEVYGYIYWLTQLKNEKCTASNTTLAELASTTDGTIENSLTALDRAGFIRRTFKENNPRKGRLEIIPLLTFNKLPSTGGRPPTSRWEELPPTGGQSKSIKKSNKDFLSENGSFPSKQSSRPTTDENSKVDVDGDGMPAPAKGRQTAPEGRGKGFEVLRGVHDLMVKETGLEPILGPVALKAINRALQHIEAKDVLLMVEDALANGYAEKMGMSLNAILSDAQINKFRLENQ